MKFRIEHQKPVKPPVEKIVLEVSPEELSILREGMGGMPCTGVSGWLYEELRRAERECKKQC